MAVKRVIFIRPGETDWNNLGRWQGWVAVPLNEHGQRQARQLARFMRNIGISALYSSDLQRAVETANILAQELDFAPILDERLRERNIGIWQGLTGAEISSWYPREYAAVLQDPENATIPCGESRRDVRERAVAALTDILKQATGETVAIISHTTAIHVLLQELIPNCYPKEIAVSNLSVTTITRQDDGGWRLVATDDVSHLDGLATQAYPELEDCYS